MLEPRRRRLSVIANFRFCGGSQVCQDWERSEHRRLGLDILDSHRYCFLMLPSAGWRIPNILQPAYYHQGLHGGVRYCKNQSILSAI